ncbi:MAG: hypothetical protein M3075_05335 [Candidatus Dormibacteraeota bacterium]|jgi:hypothetical protein|nr:hypothetical protein [Candidatus Dormibacteraeota bacterium]
MARKRSETQAGNGAAHESVQVSVKLARNVSELNRARQRAQDALLRARLECRSPQALAQARQRAQRAADELHAARLANELAGDGTRPSRPPERSWLRQQ